MNDADEQRESRSFGFMHRRRKQNGGTGSVHSTAELTRMRATFVSERRFSRTATSLPRPRPRPCPRLSISSQINFSLDSLSWNRIYINGLSAPSMAEENIRNFCRPPAVIPSKPPRYASKYNPEAAPVASSFGLQGSTRIEGANLGDEPNKQTAVKKLSTFGPRSQHFGDTKNFLRANRSRRSGHGESTCVGFCGRVKPSTSTRATAPF